MPKSKLTVQGARDFLDQTEVTVTLASGHRVVVRVHGPGLLTVGAGLGWSPTQDRSDLVMERASAAIEVVRAKQTEALAIVAKSPLQRERAKQKRRAHWPPTEQKAKAPPKQDIRGFLVRNHYWNGLPAGSIERGAATRVMEEYGVGRLAADELIRRAIEASRKR